MKDCKEENSYTEEWSEVKTETETGTGTGVKKNDIK